MATLVWDQVGDRIYENGLDRGVLYLSDGSGIVWNGLVKVSEAFDVASTPIYFDGAKVNDVVTLGDYAATLTALTYPDEFLEYEGIVEFRAGAYLGNQPLKTFGLSYRTQINSDTEAGGYKLHILYNLTAIPSDQTYETMTDSSEAMEFEWTITAVPEERVGRRPTAHVILDSRKIEPDLLAEIEGVLYGNADSDATLLTFSNLLDFIEFTVVIIDHGDGTWTAISQREGFITDDGTGDGEFTIDNVNATYSDADTFDISDTLT